MTRLHLILSFILLAGTALTAQPSYLDYHKGVLKTETLITERKYDEALEELETLFTTYNFVFLREYKIAAQLAMLNGDYDKMYQYLEAGISKGWTLRNIKKNRLFSPLRKDPEWKILKSRQDSLLNLQYKNLNMALREEVHQMFKRDQKMAIGALFRIGQKAQDRYAERKFAPHSEKQLARLKEILIVHGYPGEQLIDNDYWVSTILSHHNSISKKYVLADTLYNELKPAILKAFERGEISPFELALAQDWKTAVQNGHNATSYGFVGRLLTDSALTVANRNRSDINLRSIELRNALVDIEKETGMDLYLPGEPWQEGKIRIAGK